MKEHTIIEIRSFRIVMLDGREQDQIPLKHNFVQNFNDNFVPQSYQLQCLQINRQPLALSETGPPVGIGSLEGNTNKVQRRRNLKPLRQWIEQEPKVLADKRAYYRLWGRLAYQGKSKLLVSLRFQITKKGNKVNYKGGCLFKIELIDADGTQIEGTFYKDSVDQFFAKLEEGKIYAISQAQVATANKKFTSIQNDYRIIFNSSSKIEECLSEKEEGEQKTQIQRFKFNFVPIKEVLTNIHDLKQIDICGINITNNPRPDDIEVKFDHGKPPVKGRLVFTLADKSNELINVNLWGELSRIEVNEGDIVIINGGRVSNFSGKTLNCGSEYCKVIVNPSKDIVPDIDNHVDLSMSNIIAQYKNQSNTSEETKQQQILDIFKDQEQKFVTNVLEELNCNQDGDYLEEGVMTKPQGIFCLQGSIIKFVTSSDQVAYLGCPICFRKVTDNRLTGFYCNTCLKIVKEKYLYFIHAIFQDFTGKLLISLSREQAETLMNRVDPHTFMTKIRKTFRQECDFEGWLNENVYFKTFRVVVKAKQETYKNSHRLRFYALDITEVGSDGKSGIPQYHAEKTSFKKENKMLLETLKFHKENA